MNQLPPFAPHFIQTHRMQVVPARVQAALALIDHLASCEAEEAGEGHATIPGRDLLPVEQAARAAALNMLMAYFAGELQPTHFEAEPTQGPALEPKSELLPCPMCDGGQRATVGVVCRMCGGKGGVIFMGPAK